MSIRAHRAVLLPALGLVGLSVACEDEAPPRPPTPPRPAARAAAPGAATAVNPEKAAGVWVYSPVGKRDPFRSYLADLKEAQLRGERKKSEETERFELDQYRLTGLVTGTAQPTAMVEDPEGKGHVLRIGSRIGKNAGRVTRITNAGIVVTEEMRSPTGERIKVPQNIKLPRSDLDLGGTP